MKAALIIPIYCPDESLGELLRAIEEQTLAVDLILVDSSPPVEHARHLAVLDSWGLTWTLLEDVYDHGYARNVGIELARQRSLRVAVFLTQDCVPALSWTRWRAGCSTVHGRRGGRYHWAPAPVAGRDSAGATDTRCHVSSLRCRSSAFLGLHSSSNSLAAYDLSALGEVGGFPQPCLFGEDAVASSRLRAAGLSVLYVPEAVAWHSHDSSLIESLQRQFDVGAGLGP